MQRSGPMPMDEERSVPRICPEPPDDGHPDPPAPADATPATSTTDTDSNASPVPPPTPGLDTARGIGRAAAVAVATAAVVTAAAATAWSTVGTGKKGQIERSRRWPGHRKTSGGGSGFATKRPVVNKLRETLVAVQQLDKNMSSLRSWLAHIETELSRPIVYDTCDDQEIQRKLNQQQLLPLELPLLRLLLCEAMEGSDCSRLVCRGPPEEEEEVEDSPRGREPSLGRSWDPPLPTPLPWRGGGAGCRLTCGRGWEGRGGEGGGRINKQALDDWWSNCCVHCILACLFCEFLTLCNIVLNCATCGSCAGDDSCFCCCCASEEFGDCDLPCDMDCGIIDACCESADCLEICMECCGLCFSS
ncbi:hypothetical protein CRUP_003443 [Coryphaenoides rupestris]|nr:hypothetical protein CRUP_003443 [Coryphaenoides rupestris]